MLRQNAQRARSAAGADTKVPSTTLTRSPRSWDGGSAWRHGSLLRGDLSKKPRDLAVVDGLLDGWDVDPEGRSAALVEQRLRADGPGLVEVVGNATDRGQP
jgi:hypothetical protein